MSAEVLRRRRLAVAAAAVALLVVAIVVVLATRGESSGPAIAEDAAALVPSDALVFAHLSTDGDRGAVQDAAELAEGFPSWERAREAVLSRLVVASEDDGEVDANAEVSSWLGDEMALALLSSPTGTAQSLVLLEVADEEQARGFVARGAARSGPAQRHRGIRIDRFGAVQAAVVDGFLVLGQPAAVRRAVDLTMGTGDPLAEAETFRRLQDKLPDDRVADAYATSDGLRRLLVPAGGGYAVAGVLLDRPGLAGTALSLSAEEPGARILVESRVAGREGEAFEPTLVDAVPKGALAYLGSKGLDDTATRLLANAGTAALGELLGRVREALGEEGAAAVQEDLLALLREETALVVLPGVPAPTMLIIARTRDEARTRAALDRLTASLPELLEGTEVAQDGDVTVITAGETEIRAAVFDDKLVLATGAAGIAAARDPDGGVGDAADFDAVVPDPGEPVTSVLFLDFSQLLRLGEQTGLNDSRAYLAVKRDLGRVRSVGASSTGTGEDTTTEIRVSIP